MPVRPTIVGISSPDALADALREVLEGRVRARLDQLAARLGEGPWLDGAFSVGDLMMVLVLRRLEGAGILEGYPALAAYIARGQARPAYRRAFAAQLAVFKDGPAKG